MFDTSSLEAQVEAYVEEKLQEQAVAIADRILMTYPTGKSVQDIMHITGLPLYLAERYLINVHGNTTISGITLKVMSWGKLK